MLTAGMYLYDVVNYFNASRVTISRLHVKIRLRYTSTTTDHNRSGIPRSTSRHQGRYVRHIYICNIIIHTEETFERAPCVSYVAYFSEFFIFDSPFGIV